MYRGGLGLVREFRLDAPEGFLSTGFERFEIPAQGAAGGRAGSLSRTTLTRADGSKTALPAKCSGVPIAAGDVITIETSGGGGYGDPALRDAAFVTVDREDGLARGRGG